MSVTNLSNQHISASYQNLMQVSSSNAVYNGTGSLVSNLTVTASYAVSASNASGYLPLTGGIVTGSINISGSVSLNSVLTLTPRTTTPTPTAGMLIVSGSGANQHIYCYLNNSWKQLNN
jgi:hypothetical protein